MKNFARISVIVAASAMALLSGCASSAKQESTGQYIDDTAITARVKTAIFKDDMLKSNEISVVTYKGRVQLSGFVSTRSSIERAGVVAKGIQGVIDVTNDLKVK